MMKGITLYEPFATLMAIGAKVNETRQMRTFHRGDICIHAAKKRERWSKILRDQAYEAMNRIDGHLSFNWGCIVAVVEIWDVQPSEKFVREILIEDPRGWYIGLTDEELNFGNYSAGRFIYRTRNLRRLKTPVLAKGLQCVGWTLPPDVEKKVRAQL